MTSLAKAIGIGLLLGAVYTLSPTTLWFIAGSLLLLKVAAQDLSQEERRLVTAAIGVAVAIRLLAVVGLFVATDHARVPFGSFFGDEEYFIKRAWWLRNVALGIPIHRADLIYAFDDYSYTSYLYVLGFLQVLLGPAPYGAHLSGMLLYLASCVILFRVARRRFGALAAHGGLLLLLFLPSLFAWSISALKEPLYFLLGAVAVWVADAPARSRRWTVRAGAVAALVALAFMQQSIRDGGLAIMAVGIGGGALLAAILSKPRITAAACLAAPVLLVAVLSQPAVQIRVARAVRQAAVVNYGHINTAGYSYKLLDPRMYEARATFDSMTLAEELRFVARALIAYVVEPLPWSIQSRAALLFQPEQVIWYVMVLLTPAGVLAGFRRDRWLASVLLMFAIASALIVALTGGNYGTLVRHRGLALPFLVWFVALGACSAIRRAIEARPAGLSADPLGAA